MSSRDQWEINVMLFFWSRYSCFLRCSSNSLIERKPSSKFLRGGCASGWEEARHVDSEEYVWSRFLLAVHLTKKCQDQGSGWCLPQIHRRLSTFLFPYLLLGCSLSLKWFLILSHSITSSSLGLTTLSRFPWSHTLISHDCSHIRSSVILGKVWSPPTLFPYQ